MLSGRERRKTNLVNADLLKQRAAAGYGAFADVDVAAGRLLLLLLLLLLLRVAVACHRRRLCRRRRRLPCRRIAR